MRIKLGHNSPVSKSQSRALSRPSNGIEIQPVIVDLALADRSSYRFLFIYRSLIHYFFYLNIR